MLRLKIVNKETLKMKTTCSMPPIIPANFQDKEVIPSVETQTITPDRGFDGLSEVKVLGDEDLQASNIKKGVSIFGIDGSMEEMPQEVKEGIGNQDEIITTQEITISDIKEIVEQKVLVKEKYKPPYISFRDCKNDNLDYELKNLDVSNLTTMYYMFGGCSNITSLDLSNFNTENVTNMDHMFYNCFKISTLDVSSFDTSKVTNMSNMFSYCQELKSLDVSMFNTINVTNMSYMFGNSKVLTSLNISNLKTNNVTNMSGMFAYLTYNHRQDINLDFSSFNTENVTNMSSMFNYCYYITELDLSSFSTPNLTNTGSMFQSCMQLKRLDIRNFTFDKVTSYSGMFNNVSSSCLIIVKGDTEKQWITSKFTSLTNVKTVAELEV